MIDNDLQDVPESITGFLDFYEKRRAALKGRLRTALGVPSEEKAAESPA